MRFTMKPNEIRNLTLEEIDEVLQDRRESLLQLRFQAAAWQLNNVKEIKTTKKEIARLLTIAGEMRLAEES